METLDSFLTNLINKAEQTRSVAEKPVLDGTNKLQGGENIPLTREDIPSLLSRAKLSPETRALEERRLASIENLKKAEAKKAKQQDGQKRSRGQFHWKRKAANKKKQNRKKYEATAGLSAILGTPYGCKRICPTLWNKYIGECFREYTPKYLTVKRIKRPPGFGQSAYYGNKKYPLTVYSFRVVHDKLGVVWDGEQQRKADGVAVLIIE